jgi:hypothetical protein
MLYPGPPEENQREELCLEGGINDSIPSRLVDTVPYRDIIRSPRSAGTTSGETMPLRGILFHNLRISRIRSVVEDPFPSWERSILSVLFL